MYELIFLGLIPGTHIQITFGLWLIVASSILLLTLAFQLKRIHFFRNWTIALSLLFAVRQTRS